MAGMKTILVTGATGGIGRAVCARLAASGCSLLLASRDAERLRLLGQELSATRSGTCSWLTVDMTSDASVEAFGRELGARGTILDGAVLMPPQPHATADSLPGNEAWREIFQGSFVGPLALLKAAIATMRPDPANGRRCRIVIVSGISSAQVLGHYATSNVIRCTWLGRGQDARLRAGRARDPRQHPVTGWHAVAAGVSYDERLDEEAANIPLRKYDTPDEVASAVEGLLSSLSDHMTGLNILHDGGFTRAY